MVLYGSSFINLIFAFRGLATALAHVGPHCVTGIALPPVDATSLFHCSSGCMRENEGNQSMHCVILQLCRGIARSQSRRRYFLFHRCCVKARRIRGSGFKVECRFKGSRYEPFAAAADTYHAYAAVPI
jgi:hypothetical protein